MINRVSVGRRVGRWVGVAVVIAYAVYLGFSTQWAVTRGASLLQRHGQQLQQQGTEEAGEVRT